MADRERALKAFVSWFENLPVHKPSGGPARGTISSALVVLERLKSNFDLSLAAHRAGGKSQIKGASGPAVAKILAKFGETRHFVSEGGRTNRGGPGDIADMLDMIKAAELNALTFEAKNAILEEFQKILVHKVRAYHNRQRLKIIYDPAKSTWQAIHDLLVFARETGKDGQIAQYLVGAKLQIRFPDAKIGNESYSTADDQLGRRGDFLLSDTVFHVTVAPMSAVYEKCRRNLAEGYRVYLLVPDARLAGARQNAEGTAAGQISVESIESFVSQNIEELSTFSKNQLAEGFSRLLETYNQRVDAVESDKSMLIEIPPNLIRVVKKRSAAG